MLSHDTDNQTLHGRQTQAKEKLQAAKTLWVTLTGKKIFCANQLQFEYQTLLPYDILNSLRDTACLSPRWPAAHSGIQSWIQAAVKKIHRSKPWEDIMIPTFDEVVLENLGE